MEGLAKSLYNSGYDKTERDSPFHDNGTLWKNSHEIICDKTGIVIRNTDEYTLDNDTETSTRKNETPRYNNSDKVILPGGMQRAYEWGDSNGEFVYDKQDYS